MPVAYPPHLPVGVLFSGGPLITLGAIVGGSGYNNGTYRNVPVVGGTGAGAVFDTIVVVGGSVTTATLINGGASVGPQGVTGYEAYDLLTASPSVIGAGTGFVVPVATLGTYAWTPPPALGAFMLDACGGGGGGGAGQAASGAGGGGGGGGSGLCDFPVLIVPGSLLTITCGRGGVGGISGGAAATNGSATTITSPGVVTDLANISLTAGNAGQPGAAAVGGLGGAGSSVGGTGGTAGNGATGGGTGGLPVWHGNWVGGGGGGGGGSSASSGGNGASGYPYSGGSTGAGVGSGGGGGPSYFGRGGRGGTGGASPIAGNNGVGFGGGGGGGGLTFPGGNGRGGMMQFRF